MGMASGLAAGVASAGISELLGGTAIAVLAVDQPAPEAALQDLQKAPHILSVKQIRV